VHGEQVQDAREQAFLMSILSAGLTAQRCMGGRAQGLAAAAQSGGIARASYLRPPTELQEQLSKCADFAKRHGCGHMLLARGVADSFVKVTAECLAGPNS
jgi:hypothetical protein